MISFRYHLITIMGIFLAIALGIVMGASFVRGPLVERLESQTAELASRLDQLREEVVGLRTFADESFPHLAEGRLSGVPVVMLSQEGTPTAHLDRVRSALAAAGARVEGTLMVSARILAAEEGSRRSLATALGLDPDTTESSESLTSAAVTALARRLASGVDGGGQDDLLERLADGFVTPSGVDPSALGELGGFGSVLVVIGGGDGAPSMEMDAFLLPLLRAYGASRPSVAVQASDSEYPFVPLARADDALAERVSTVDDLERVTGQLAIVLAVADLAEGAPPGHYGLEGDSALPPVRELPEA